MSYDLMLLADPGPERGEVLRILAECPDIRPDPQLESRFWLRTSHGEAQINVGSKDPVESLHVEFDSSIPPLAEAATRRTLELAEALRMRVEDVQWGDEVTAASLPRLKEFWRRGADPAAAAPGRAAASRPWWRFWQPSG